ncbi:transcription repressor [Rhynchospora pubera]|uniref:Transcription repressor n=1 Tax=Rhynchospora pubera TaxID=906938 RepID=A0AAV8C7M0_9POAL|nr:transcription repressor [Rhynchospora pubera]
MGKYKFRLSDMVPNAWFYKLRDMGHKRRRNQNYLLREDLACCRTSRLSRKSFTSPPSPPKQSFVPHRSSYYYSNTMLEARENLSSPVHLTKRRDVDIPLDSPRKSKRRSHRRHLKVLINSPSPKRISTSSLIQCNCSHDKVKFEKSPTKNHETRVFDSEEGVSVTDYTVRTGKKCSSPKFQKNDNSSKVIELALSPVRTRLDRAFKDNDNSFYTINKRPQLKTKRASQAVHRIRTRVISPRVATKSATKGKKMNQDLKDSLAVMKFSSDPQRDFMESMIEMIIANNMRSSRDLEDLLACYLSLNSDYYHSVIVKVFKEVWFDLNKLRIIE